MNELIVDAIKDELESLGWEYEVEDEYGSYSISSFVERKVGNISIFIDVEDDKTRLCAIHSVDTDIYSSPLAFRIVNDKNSITDLKLVLYFDKSEQTPGLWCYSAPIFNDSIWAEDAIREAIFKSVHTIEYCYNRIKQDCRGNEDTQSPAEAFKFTDVEYSGAGDEDVSNKLFTAAYEGNIEEVQRLLSTSGIDVNKVNKQGFTPLSSAATGGRTEIVKLLLSAPGIDVNKANPLINAVRQGYEEIVKLLLASSDIDVTKADEYDFTPLYVALIDQNVEMVKLLLTAPGIDINNEVAGRLTPLYLAVSNNNVEMVKLLLNVPGIDVNNEGAGGLTPLYSAVLSRQVEMVKLLLSAPNIDINKGDPLYAAQSGGYTEIVSLLQNAAKKNEAPTLKPVENKGGGGYMSARQFSPAPVPVENKVDDRLMKNLYAATRTGNIERVRQLLEKPGIDINKPIEGMTFLYVASLYGYSEIVSLLIEIPGIDVNKSYRGLTPLCVASMDGFSEVVRILLATPGIDIDKGKPINVARQKGHMEVVELLQEAMTNRLTAPASDSASHEESPIENPVDESLMRELVLAVAAGNTEEVRDLLLQPGIDINGAVDGYTPLYAASVQGHTDVVRLLLSVPGLDVNNADHKDGETPLLSSAGHGYTEIVKLLLAAPGINVNKANNDGNNPLHAAAGQGHAEIVKLLLTVPGIDVNTVEAEHSPLALASFMGHTEVVRLLLSCPGIDVNRGNPLLVAKHEGHTAIVRLLLAAGA